MGNITTSTLGIEPSTLYTKLKEKYNDIIEVDPHCLDFWQEQNSITVYAQLQTFLKPNALLKLFPKIAFPIFFVEALNWNYYLTNKIIVLLDQKTFFANHKGYLISLIVFVLYGLPIMFKISRTSMAIEGALDEKKKEALENRILYRIPSPSQAGLWLGVWTYISLFALLILIASYTRFPTSILWWCVFILILIILLLTYLYLMALPTLIIPTLILFKSKSYKFKAHTEVIDVLRHLLKLLDMLTNINSLSSLSIKEKINIANFIEEISQWILHLAPQNQTNSTSKWFYIQMEKASINFLTLVRWVYLPQEGTLDFLKERVIFYINIFLSGKYYDLPRDQSELQQEFIFFYKKQGGIKNMVVLFLFVSYLVFPLLLYILGRGYYGISVLDQVDPIWWLFYPIWVALGTSFFIERLSGDTKVLAKEIVEIFKSPTEVLNKFVKSK